MYIQHKYCIYKYWHSRYIFICVYICIYVCVYVMCVYIPIYTYIWLTLISVAHLSSFSTSSPCIGNHSYSCRVPLRRYVWYFSPYVLSRCDVASMIGLGAAFMSVHDRFLVTACVTSPTEGPLAGYSHLLSQRCLSVLLPAPSLPLGPLATHLPRKWAGKQSSPSPPEVRRGTVRTPHLALPSLTDVGLPIQEALPSRTPTPSGAWSYPPSGQWTMFV